MTIEIDRTSIRATKRAIRPHVRGTAVLDASGKSRSDVPRVGGCPTDLNLSADAGIKSHPEIFRDAARLDHSMALDAAAYVERAQPRFERIAAS